MGQESRQHPGPWTGQGKRTMTPPSGTQKLPHVMQTAQHARRGGMMTMGHSQISLYRGRFRENCQRILWASTSVRPGSASKAAQKFFQVKLRCCSFLRMNSATSISCTIESTCALSSSMGTSNGGLSSGLRSFREA